MQTIGIVLILCGAYLIYETLHSRLGSLPSSQPSSQPGSTSDGGKKSSSSQQTDSGQHEAVDSSGNVYTIDKPYGSMSDQEKDDANRFAHQMGG